LAWTQFLFLDFHLYQNDGSRNKECYCDKTAEKSILQGVPENKKYKAKAKMLWLL
jgi:hypothetical protein